MTNLQSITAFLSDIRFAVAAENLDAVLYRVNLFEALHVESDEEQGIEMPGRKRLVLRTDTDELVVCDEYYPEDNGRVHMIPTARYATFHADAMTLEFQKVIVDIVEIVYEGFTWPVDMSPTSYEGIVAHFSEEPTS